MNKKKIVIIHHSDALGGAGVSLLNVVKMLQDDYNVKVILPHKDKAIANFFKEKNIEFDSLSDNIGMISAYSGGPKILTRTFLRNFLKIKYSKKKLRKIILRERPDIVAVNSMTLTWAGSLIQSMGCQSICFVRETFVKNMVMLYIKHLLNKHFNSVVFISEFDKYKFKCKAPVTAVVRNCVNFKDYQTKLDKAGLCEHLGINKNKFNVLFVGGLDKLKGWDVVVKAMHSLKSNSIDLIVAGATQEQAQTKFENISFIGKRNDMSLVYNACDLLVFPSISAHQARPVFEAGMCNIPVVISDFAETKDSVIDGFNGLVFEPSNSDELAQKILLLYENKELWVKLANNNKKQALKYHEFDCCKLQLKSLLDTLEKE
jgi:glycosyltransferase involved in cell wall biosynthesis